MSKFHVGDRVRVHAPGHGEHGKIGVVVDGDRIAKGLSRDWDYRVQLDDGDKVEIILSEQELRPSDIKALPAALPEMTPIQQAVDVVNHPPHYNRFPVEVINITEQLDFNRGNVVKYVARAGFKEGVDEMEDLQKAAWYLNRAIEKLTKEREIDDVAD